MGNVKRRVEADDDDHDARLRSARCEDGADRVGFAAGPGRDRAPGPAPAPACARGPAPPSGPRQAQAVPARGRDLLAEPVGRRAEQPDDAALAGDRDRAVPELHGRVGLRPHAGRLAQLKRGLVGQAVGPAVAEKGELAGRGPGKPGPYREISRRGFTSYPCSLFNNSGNSRIDSSRKSGRAARRRFSVGNGPSTAIARTPALLAISKSSGESPT